ncbi:MAG: CheY-like chemotaxis protein [Planctomycetota bacterium]|jgi:CheY-like chemotaxis protein
MSDLGLNPPETPRLRSFHELMRWRVQRILFVSSLYDSFIMSEEGQLHETLLGHFIDLKQSHTPDLVQVSNTEQALKHLARDDSFDLIISSIATSDSDAVLLARATRAAGFDIPVMALAYTSTQLREFTERYGSTELERIFLWQGDVRILLTMVTNLEDHRNVAIDTGVNGVPAIILVEDSIRYYSSFLPEIYAELFKHTHRLVSENRNQAQRMLRLRARPKVLLCSNFEDAWGYYEKYQDQVLGIISDFEFPMDGKLEKQAGLELCKRALACSSHVRIVMQSSEPENRAAAEAIGASFLLKGSATVLHQMREVLVKRFGFGDFVFRGSDGKVVSRAADVQELKEAIREVSDETLLYHARRNHFSNWLKARTEFSLAERFRVRDADDFESMEELRSYVLAAIDASIVERRRTVIANFDRKSFEPSTSFTRIGGGSLGGKARGVAFANRILRTSGLEGSYPGVDILVPPAVVLGTEVFDQFLEYGHLREFAMEAHPSKEILMHFLDAPFPREADSNLLAFLQRVKYPLAVRSSSLLEDSLSQPFAGVYQTHMLANNDPDTNVRLRQLQLAVKRVYASAFTEKAKSYLSMTSYRLEEEKMAVMIQQLVGQQHGQRFYPDFAGVARSHNYYPGPDHKAEDGVVAVALGMGRAVVGGEPCLRFNPRYPRQLVGFSSVDESLKNSQREFYGINMDRHSTAEGVSGMHRFPLEHAEEDGTLTWLGSTYSAQDNRIIDGISRPGVRLVSFAQVLKHDAFPLAAIVRDLLDRCVEGTGAPVEIEFAGNLGKARKSHAQFSFLQLRPLAVAKEQEDVEIGDIPEDSVMCRSTRVLGNGKIDDIFDLIVVDITSFKRLRSQEVALQVAHFDAVMRKEKRPYALIGVGRWGSSDPSLGIPVGWNEIAGARVIVEAGFDDLKVEPSQGTHFFQNLASCNVGYFTVNPEDGDGSLDWDWLASVPATTETEFVRHLRLPQPIMVKMSGHASEGVIIKPEDA